MEEIETSEAIAKEAHTSETAAPNEPASSELPSADDHNEEKDCSNNEKKKTRNRKRKKALHCAIRAQMEFYFSDANLSKDRYMQNAIKEGPEVLLSDFLKFNRIKNISEDLHEIQKALEHSTVLKLSDDKTKVSRIIPFCPRSQEEEELCTVYVEHLPPTADLDWVTNVFSEFGEVAYVSLPKYKDGRNKGFAFVEYKQPNAAVGAVKAYSATSAYESLVQDPSKLFSIRAFNEEKIEDASDKKDIIQEKCDENEERETNDQSESKKSKLDKEAPAKVTDNDKENEADEGPKKKRMKLDESENVAECGAEKSTEAGDQVKQDLDDTALSTKKNKKKKKKKLQLYDDAALSYEAETLPLQVMSKKEWKKLRNKYLNMQRKCLRQLRMNAFRHHSYHEHDYNYEEGSRNGEERTEEHPNAEVKVEHGVQFDTGLIVKITLDEPIMDAKRFKSQVRSQDGVSYVEAQDGGNFAFVRCNDAAAARSLVEKKIWQQTSILEGDEEKEYWRKIEDNRVKKREKSTKQKKPTHRGNKKENADSGMPGLPSKAAQHKSLHIRFDDSADAATTTNESNS